MIFVFVSLNLIKENYLNEILPRGLDVGLADENPGVVHVYIVVVSASDVCDP